MKVPQEELERRARRKCGCRQCSNPDKHPCGVVLSVAIPVVRDILGYLGPEGGLCGSSCPGCDAGASPVEMRCEACVVKAIAGVV